MLSPDNFRWPRRSFLSRIAAGITAFGASLAGAPARGQAPTDTPFRPARHAEDDWLDQLPGRHRLFFDSVSASGFGDALRYSNTYFTANKSGYGLDDANLAVVICARHQATAFAYADAIWAKYGIGLAERAHFTDPKTGKPPTVNVYQASGYDNLLGNNGITVDAMLQRGVHLAVCRLATRALAATIARQTGGNPDDVSEELVAHLVPHSHIVAAGIVAVNRAQEHGYTFAYAG
jgi:intracellular sulfur oxidation DsrE/DsrF family protein